MGGNNFQVSVEAGQVPEALSQFNAFFEQLRAEALNFLISLKQEEKIKNPHFIRLTSGDPMWFLPKN